MGWGVTPAADKPRSGSSPQRPHTRSAPPTPYSMDLKPGVPLTRHEIVELLEEARERTLMLIRPLDDDEITMQHDSIMSPVLWDLGHIAHFEEVWLIEKLADEGANGEGLRGMYNAFDNPRAVRNRLPLPGPRESVEYMARVRRKVFSTLAGDPVDEDRRLLRRGYVFRMVLQHEYQHNETILQTLQLKKGRPHPAPRAATGARPAAHTTPGTMVRFPGGHVEIGTDDVSLAYDNERPRHTVELEAFWIDATPVTCGDYLRFIADGGYGRHELWTAEGLAWLNESGAKAPAYWLLEDGAWRTRVMDRVRDVANDHPVCHVCSHEAEAYARWAGKRLPTEVEWEAAASWDSETGRKSWFPWGDEPPTSGHANLDALVFDTSPVGSCPLNVSPIGCYGMIGDVWEWTSSVFSGYPGFEAFPYEEYSQVFFGSDQRVLRGGSWATRPGAVRNTFRNWDLPVRRQIFAGFRCARDD